MKVGYAVLYTDGTLVISKNHPFLNKQIIKDYGGFEDINVPWKKESEQIEKVQILDPIKSNCMRAWFTDCLNLTTLLNFKDLNTSDCTDFNSMFACCKSLQNINELQNWNVSNSTDFAYMFCHCESLQDLNGLQTWNVSNGTDFQYMFYTCKLLKNLNGLQNWNVYNGRNFSGMFESCKLLQDINELENWNVSNGTDFSGMFYNCQSLQEIFLTNTLDRLTKEMFLNCNPNLKIHWKKHIYSYADLLEYKKIY